MRDFPIPPYHLELNTVMQTVATAVLWAGTIALLAYAYRLARQERSLFRLLLVLAVATGSLMAINTPDPSTLVMWLTVPISVAFSATSLWWTTQLLWRDRSKGALPAPQPARTVEEQLVQHA